MDDLMKKAWEEYQLTALVSRPAKALSKREFEAGFKSALALVNKAAYAPDMSDMARVSLIRVLTDPEH